MTKIVYDAVLMKFMTFFENITGAALKDCFIDKNEMLMFVVAKNEIGRAVGKKAANVKRIEAGLNRKIKIVEFNPNLTDFVRNLIYPMRVKSISEQDNVIVIEPEDSQTRGYIIGRGAQNLRNYEETVRRYFPNVQEMRVI